MKKFFICGFLINTLFIYTYNNNKKIFYTINIISISYLISYNIIYLL